MSKVLIIGENDELQCPCCAGSLNMHHTQVDVWEREEDEAECLHTRVMRSGTVMHVSDGRGNPSRRRHGLAITLYCELCPSISVLEIAQHKGLTQITHRCLGDDL
jgi:hypothetical protein